MHVTKISDTQVSISGCIASYPHLHEPHQVNASSPPKYGLAVILPADLDQADWDILNGMVSHVLALKFPQGVPQNASTPFNPAGDKNPEFAGRYLLNCYAAADRRPQVVRENPRELAEPGECYPGCGVNVFLGCYAYDTGGNKGASFGLNAVQIADRSLPNLAGGKAAHEVFGQVAVAAASPQAVGMPGPAGPTQDAQMPQPVNPAPHQPSPQPAPAAPVGVPGPAGPGPQTH